MNYNYNDIQHLDAKDNPLLITQNDIDIYNDILNIIHTYNTHYAHSRKFKIYIPWINSKTPKLQDSIYQISTKLYWILNGWTDFPRCKQCGKELNRKNTRLISKYPQFCSIKCVANNSEIRAKKECTCEKKYGKGIKNPSQASSIKLQKEQTSLKHYGVTNPNKIRSVRLKIEQTCLKKYGAKSPFESLEIQKKIAQINIKNLGVANPFELTSTAQKGLEGRLKKYGSVMGKMKIYVYNGVSFDSSWELAVWIYHIDNNISIERQPIKLQYEMNGSMHTYFPDFKINGKLVEIKGDHLFDEYGNPIFNHKHSWKEKYQCMLDNNVIIWKYKDIKPFITYVFQTYGKDYLKQFRVKVDSKRNT